MDASMNDGPKGYTDAYGRKIDDNIDDWFTYGVKAAGDDDEGGFCSKRTTFFVFVTVIAFIILCAVIIVPVVVGNAYPKKAS